MSTTYLTKNDLAESTRGQMVELLNSRLASATHLVLQSKLAHWNVKGPEFIALHELFDQLYARASEWVDLIAERAVMLGGVAEGTLAKIAEGSALPKYRLDISDGPEHVDAVSTALATFGKAVRDAIDQSDSAGDMATADLFTEVSRAVDKMLWFVEAHQQSGAQARAKRPTLAASSS